MKPEVVQCPDRHFHCVLWGLAPYIADYQEQLTVACIVQYWCAWYVIRLFIYFLLNFVHRCRAFPNNLDGPESSDRRSRAHRFSHKQVRIICSLQRLWNYW